MSDILGTRGRYIERNEWIKKKIRMTVNVCVHIRELMKIQEEKYLIVEP